MFGSKNIDPALERIAAAFERQTIAIEKCMEAAIASHKASEAASAQIQRRDEAATKSREIELKIKQIELERWQELAANSSEH